MKLSCLIFLFFHLSLSAGALGFDCAPKAAVVWNQIAEGVDWTTYDLSFTPYFKAKQEWDTAQSRSTRVRALKIDLSKNQLLFHRPEKHPSCDPSHEKYIQKLIETLEPGVIASINANFFIMPDGNILGLAIDEKKTWSRDLTGLTISSSGVMGYENGVFFLEPRDQFISRYGPVMNESDVSRFSFAIQAYPRLLKDRELQISDQVKDVKLPRTSIGIAQNPNEVILVTIDAHGIRNLNGMTLFEYAHFLKNEKCGVGQVNALNLDGGGSTAFAVPSSQVFEQADRCRKLGNILTIRQR